MMTAKLILFFAVFLLLYVYVGYPVLVALWARFRPRLPLSGSGLPSISILVIAHNEASGIAAKIENLLTLERGSHEVDITITSDGSTDQTAQQAARFREDGVQVLAFDHQRGKPAILNQVVPGLSGEIVVLMDARQRISSNALLKLLQYFNDPKVGAVSGELVLEPRNTRASEAVSGVGFYWHYEKFIRRQEAMVDSSVGTTGALYAFRRSLYCRIPEDTLLDDVLVPMNIVKQGYRVLFEPQAIAYDRMAASVEAEFARKARTLCGNYQLFFRQPWLLDPRVNRIWLQTISHKFLRLLGPALLLLIMFCNLLLLESSFFRLLLLLQVVFYSLACLGHLNLTPIRRWKVVSVPYAFCLLNVAAAAGFIRYVRDRQKVTWRHIN